MLKIIFHQRKKICHALNEQKLDQYVDCLKNFPDTNKVGKLLERQLTLMLALHHFSKSFFAKVEKKE